MLRKLALGVSYFFATAFIISFLVPFSSLMDCVYSNGLQHCQGPDLDAFLLAAALTPFGTIGTAFALRNALHNIRKKQSLWLFWPLAIIFSIVLLGVLAMIAIVVIDDIFHKPALHFLNHQ